MNKIYSILIIALLFPCLGIHAQNRLVQFAHNSVDSSLDTVDVYLNNLLLYDNLPFRHATPFLEFPAWDGFTSERIHVLPNESTDTILAVIGWTLPTNNGIYQVIMNGVYNAGEFPGTQFIHFDVSAETELNASNNNQFKLRFHHGVDDGPALDIGESSTAFPDIWANNIAYGGFSPYIERNDSIYRVGIFSDDILVLNYAGYFNDDNYLGNASTLILSGLAGPEFIETELTASLYQISSEGGPFIELFPASVLDTANVQFIHASTSSDLQTVDVYLNGNLWLDNFQSLQATPFTKIPANRNIQLAVCGAESTSASNPIFTAFFNIPISTQVAVLTGQTNTIAEPTHPLQLVWRDQARQIALEGDEIDVLFFNAAIDLSSCDIRAFEPVNAGLCQNLNYGTFASAGYISIPPFNYELNILDSAGITNIASFKFDVAELSGEAIVQVLTGLVNPEANPDGTPLGLHYTTGSGGLLVPCTITTGNEKISDNFSHQVFPNPASESLMIQRNVNVLEPSFIEIRNAFGLLVFTQSTSETLVEIDLAKFTSGLYFIRIFDTAKSELHRVIVTR